MWKHVVWKTMIVNLVYIVELTKDLPFKWKSLKDADSICAADSQCASGSCGYESWKCQANVISNATTQARHRFVLYL